MRSIEARFARFQRQRPNVSSLLNLGAAIKGQQFSTDRVSRALTRLVERDDFCKSERRSILRHLVGLTQEVSTREAYRNEAQNASLRGKNAPV